MTFRVVVALVDTESGRAPIVADARVSPEGVVRWMRCDAGGLVRGTLERMLESIPLKSAAWREDGTPVGYGYDFDRGEWVYEP